MIETTTRAPRHLWIVGVLAVLWNAIGVFDFSATQLRLESYMGQFTPAQLEYFYGFPGWAIAAWGIAVWGSLLGSIALLLRKSWAVWLFGVAIVGMLLAAFHNLVLTDGLSLMGPGAGIFTAIIWIIAFGLFFYARAMVKRGILR